MRKGTCKYFNCHNNVCEAGVCYRDVTPDPGTAGCALRLPCHTINYFNTPHQQAHFDRRGKCDKYIEPTPQEISAFDKRMDDAMKRMMATLPLIDKIKKEHRGENWRGIVECPHCKGKLHLEHHLPNGHVWGKCETENCLNWAE